MRLRSLIFIGAIVLAGCDQLGNPSKVCANPSTLEALDDLALNAGSEFNIDNHAMMKAAIQRSQTKVKWELITLAGVDKATKKITCQTQAHLEPAPPVQKAMDALGMSIQVPNPGNDVKVNGQVFEVPVTFTRQPSADGKGFVFTLDHTMDIGAFLYGAGKILLTSEESTQAAPPSNEGVLRTKLTAQQLAAMKECLDQQDNHGPSHVCEQFMAPNESLPGNPDAPIMTKAQAYRMAECVDQQEGGGTEGAPDTCAKFVSRTDRY